jgi:CO dehydrogenase nickel-insertion accessory protein CooC1
MRIAICGKGGSGKTTIAATMARFFGRRGLAVTALDGDPNPNLAAALGVPASARASLRRVPREEILEERTDARGAADLHLKRRFEDVLGEYGLRAPDNVSTLSMVGLLGAGKG